MQKKNWETTIYIQDFEGKGKGLLQAIATKTKLFLSLSLKCGAVQHLSTEPDLSSQTSLSEREQR